MHEKRDVTAPGIVVLSSALGLLHMNRRALALLTQLEQTAQNVETERTVTEPLHQHGQDIVETLQARLADDNWEPFHHYRAIGPASHTILLKGFGIPDRRGLSHSRIVMLLSPHRPAADAEHRQQGTLERDLRKQPRRGRQASCSRPVTGC